MQLINNSTNSLSHGEYKLPKGEKADIPDEIAEVWLDIPGVSKYFEEKDVKQAEAKAKEETDKIKSELEKAKDEIEKLKTENEKLKKTKSEGEKQAEAKAKEETKKSNTTK